MGNTTSQNHSAYNSELSLCTCFLTNTESHPYLRPYLTPNPTPSPNTTPNPKLTPNLTPNPNPTPNPKANPAQNLLRITLIASPSYV